MLTIFFSRPQMDYADTTHGRSRNECYKTL